MSGRRASVAARPRRGFTLLEAVLAITVLAIVAAAVFELRARSIGAGERLIAAQERAQDADAVFTMLVQGALGRPEVDESTGAAVWEGVLGERGFRVTRERVSMPNPVAPTSSAPLAESVGMWEYSVEIEGAETRFLWHR